MKLRAGLVVGCAAAILLSKAAHAEGNPAADDLFRAGKEAMARGDIAHACALFTESLRYEPASGTQLNLADCEQRSGHLARALGLFAAGRARLPPGDFRIPFTDERIASLTKEVPELTIRPRGDVPPGTRFFCDGDELAVGVASRVDAGGHAVVVQVPLRREQRIEVILAPGERRVVDVDTGDSEQSDGRPAAAHEGGGRRAAAAYVAGSIGVAGVVVGAVTGLMTMHAARTYEDHCHYGQCDSTGLDAASTGRSLQVVSPVSFAVGVVGIGTGTWLLLTAPSPSSPRAAIAPAVAPGAAGISLSGAF